MKYGKFKNFFAVAWPFFGLAFFLIWGFIYIKPLLPDDFFSAGRVAEKVAGIFRDKAEPVNPDEKYDFFYSHSDLKPKTKEELGLGEEFIFTDISVDEDGQAVTAGTSEELKKAVKNSQAGGRVALKAGEYRVNLEIDKNITIIGQGSSTVLSAKDEGRAVIKINKSELSVKNLQINHARTGIEAYSAKLNIENVKFSGLAAAACYVKDSELNFKNSMIYDSGSAIKAINSFGGISRSIIENNAKSGVDLRSSKFRIQGNIIEGNGSYGVFADQYSEAKIEDNFIDNNQGFEVRIEGQRKIYR